MKLSGHTKPFAVLGHPIGHTLSPVMHNAAIQELGMDAIYLALDVPPEKLMQVLPAMADMGFGGVNLTVPLKEIAFKGLEDLDESAKMSGSVNTIEFTENGMRGHSTDGKGFLLAIDEAFSTTVSDQSVFILGSGGAGRAVAITCANEGAKKVIVTDIDPKRSEQVAKEITEFVPQAKVEIADPDPSAWSKASKEADIVVQSTPIGMKQEDKPLLGPESFRPEQFVFDLIYMYPETGFLKAAREAGAKTANGLGMLLHQGAFSFSIWTKIQEPVDVMRKALEAEVYGGK